MTRMYLKYNLDFFWSILNINVDNDPIHGNRNWWLEKWPIWCSWLVKKKGALTTKLQKLWLKCLWISAKKCNLQLWNWRNTAESMKQQPHKWLPLIITSHVATIGLVDHMYSIPTVPVSKWCKHNFDGESTDTKKICIAIESTIQLSRIVDQPTHVII